MFFIATPKFAVTDGGQTTWSSWSNEVDDAANLNSGIVIDDGSGKVEGSRSSFFADVDSR